MFSVKGSGLAPQSKLSRGCLCGNMGRCRPLGLESLLGLKVQSFGCQDKGLGF